MPKKYIHAGQGEFQYVFITGSGDVVSGRNGFAQGTIDINSPSAGITTYKKLTYKNRGLEDTVTVGRRANDVSRFYDVGGVFSDFYIFAQPNVNTKFNHLTKSLSVSQDTSLTGNLQYASPKFTLEDIKAYPRVDISKNISVLGPAGNLKSGGEPRKTFDFLDGTTLRRGSVISNANASNFDSFKIPWNCIVTQSLNNGDLGVITSSISARSRNAYDPKYYLHYQNVAKMDDAIRFTRVTIQNDIGDTYASLKNNANKPLGAGGTIVPGTIQSTGVAPTTIKVQDTQTINDGFSVLTADSGIKLTPNDSGPGCFPAGTIIHTENGDLKIENVLPGMNVVSYDPAGGGLFVMNQVKALLVHKTGNPALEIVTSDDSTIQSTFYHKFYHPGLEIYKPIHRFQVGDPLKTRSGSTFIKEIRKISSFDIEYNVELIGEPRSYLANGIVVHNIKASPPMFPSEVVTQDDANPNL